MASIIAASNHVSWDREEKKTLTLAMTMTHPSQ